MENGGENLQQKTDRIWVGSAHSAIGHAHFAAAARFLLLGRRGHLAHPVQKGGQRDARAAIVHLNYKFTDFN